MMVLTDKQAKHYNALDHLLKNAGFLEEMENANYHGAVQFLEEIRDFGFYKEWDGDKDEV